jgi:hypothetical protein
MCGLANYRAPCNDNFNSLLGLLALGLLNFLTALLAFVFQEITPFHMIKSDLVAWNMGLFPA